MITAPHIPVLRLGRVYESLDKITVLDHRTGEPRAQVSTVNAGIIRKDLQKIGAARAALRRFTTSGWAVWRLASVMFHILSPRINYSQEMTLIDRAQCERARAGGGYRGS